MLFRSLAIAHLHVQAGVERPGQVLSPFDVHPALAVALEEALADTAFGGVHGEPFATCAKLSRPAALRSCGADDPCRPDYLCARASATTNVCLPPYFVLQMRVDGHLLGLAHPHTAPRVSH